MLICAKTCKSPRPKPSPTFCLITEECLIFMENKYHMLCLECYKDHFKFPHDGASPIISICLDLSQKGESKNEICVLCILVDNLKTLHFYKQ